MEVSNMILYSYWVKLNIQDENGSECVSEYINDASEPYNPNFIKDIISKCKNIKDLVIYVKKEIHDDKYHCFVDAMQYEIYPSQEEQKYLPKYIIDITNKHLLALQD